MYVHVYFRVRQNLPESTKVYILGTSSHKEHFSKVINLWIQNALTWITIIYHCKPMTRF